MERETVRTIMWIAIVLAILALLIGIVYLFTGKFIKFEI